MSAADVYEAASMAVVVGIMGFAVVSLIVRWLRRRPRSRRRDRGSDYEESGDSTLASREHDYNSSDSGGGDGGGD